MAPRRPDPSSFSSSRALLNSFTSYPSRINMWITANFMLSKPLSVELRLHSWQSIKRQVDASSPRAVTSFVRAPIAIVVFKLSYFARYPSSIKRHSLKLRSKGFLSSSSRSFSRARAWMDEKPYCELPRYSRRTCSRVTDEFNSLQVKDEI